MKNIYFSIFIFTFKLQGEEAICNNDDIIIICNNNDKRSFVTFVYIIFWFIVFNSSGN